MLTHFHIEDDGHLFTWGWNKYGQVFSLPEVIITMSNIFIRVDF